MRDIQGDYRRAYIEEYEGYRRAGFDEAAERVAVILREQYGHEVAPEPEQDPPKPERATPERADEEKPPENAIPARPARQPRKPAANKPPTGA